MQSHAMGQDTGPKYSAAGLSQVTDTTMVDVSRHAWRLSVCASVHIDPEAFGVMVTRRPDAKVTSLTAYEESRLLDVLVHMKEALPRCNENGCEFQVWVISSDARDAKPRVQWVTLEKGAQGSYELCLSDA